MIEATESNFILTRVWLLDLFGRIVLDSDGDNEMWRLECFVFEIRTSWGALASLICTSAF